MGKPLRFCLHPTLLPCCLPFSHIFPLLPQIFHSPRCLSVTEGQRQVSGFEDTAIATSIPLDEGPVWQDNHLGGILMKFCQELGDNLKKEGDGEYTNFQNPKNAFGKCATCPQLLQRGHPQFSQRCSPVQGFRQSTHTGPEEGDGPPTLDCGK